MRISLLSTGRIWGVPNPSATSLGEGICLQFLHYDAKLASMNYGTIGGCERQPITAKNSEKQRGWPLFFSVR
jgi:hypothetical protein